MSSNEAVVQSALQLLSKSLNLHIEKVLAPHLESELHWTDVLHQLDKIKGKSPKVYSHTDVQPQLRIITERLGALGYPFSANDPQRLMSIYGNELRLIRNRWAHGDTFSAMEAMRATDTVFIVLTHIGDKEAAGSAATLRGSVIKELVAEPSAESDMDEDEPVDATDVVEKPESAEEQEPAKQQEAPFERFSGVRTAFEPWEIVVTGNVETLDNLPKKTAKESVRSTIEEIVDLEGPIHRDRLTKLVGYTYGLGKVHDARAKKIVAQINGSACFTDKEKFVWPADTDPHEWKIYRTSSLGDARVFTQISPLEIANAATDILKRKGAIPAQELRRLVLRTFGRTKATKGLSAHFNKAIELATVRGLVSITNGGVSLMESSIAERDLQGTTV
ncbi:DUF3320 domain-containing protein [Pseudarthrobacter sp. C1]|uniref:DUF3320 domain-containing protein n=1 Tax=Pseudarthrobacter sp. C1 TaxID=3108940 RepID=UPI002B057BE4|nr:DUF3320 domain-containing protein [Pseudarthrobacter sp. C1]MEA3549232.1 DUF3320 domain-containing protein [Pseudarthrobacter sp. C1]